MQNEWCARVLKKRFLCAAHLNRITPPLVAKAEKVCEPVHSERKEARGFIPIALDIHVHLAKEHRTLGMRKSPRFLECENVHHARRASRQASTMCTGRQADHRSDTLEFPHLPVSRKKNFRGVRRVPRRAERPAHRRAHPAFKQVRHFPHPVRNRGCSRERANFFQKPAYRLGFAEECKMTATCF